jgi:hypothetical protein
MLFILQRESMLSLAMITWTQIVWSIGLSAIILLVVTISGGLTVVYLPEDYFVSQPRKKLGRSAVLQWSFLVVRNLVGVALIVLGVLMLVLPGPGVLTIGIGLVMLSFPGKRNLVASLIRRFRATGSLNRFRTWFGRPPLTFDQAE